MENQESQIGGNGLTLSDPLSKPKKWAVGLTVCIMILMMLATFAVFHWLYSEYFRFSANKAACVQELADMKARCSDLDEELARKKQDFASLIKGFKERYDSTTKLRRHPNHFTEC